MRRGKRRQVAEASLGGLLAPLEAQWQRHSQVSRSNKRCEGSVSLLVSAVDAQPSRRARMNHEREVPNLDSFRWEQPPELELGGRGRVVPWSSRPLAPLTTAPRVRKVALGTEADAHRNLQAKKPLWSRRRSDPSNQHPSKSIGGVNALNDSHAVIEPGRR